MFSKNSKILGIFILVLSVFVQLGSALSASSIGDCPQLPARSGPTGVNDIRPDDIKVMAAMGDRYIIIQLSSC